MDHNGQGARPSITCGIPVGQLDLEDIAIFHQISPIRKQSRCVTY